MTALIASDLDRTLLYSAAALALGAPVADPVCVEHLDGEPISYLPAAALAGLELLSRRAAVVPATTRTFAQYDRIRLPGVRIEHAIVTNGAAIIHQGRPCPVWAAEVDRRLAAGASYTMALRTLRPILERPWVHKIRDAEERFIYLIIAAADPDWYDELAAALEPLGWVLSVQGRKAYLIPAPLTKQAAVAEVASRIGATRVLAAGDSLLDQGMLAAADEAIRPAHGELADRGWIPDGGAVTELSGAGAAVEIVEWFTDRVAGKVPTERIGSTTVWSS